MGQTPLVSAIINHNLSLSNYLITLSSIDPTIRFLLLSLSPSLPLNFFSFYFLPSFSFLIPFTLRDENRFNALDYAKTCDDESLRVWSKFYMAYLGRYRIEEGPPEYSSATCDVFFAVDLKDNEFCIFFLLIRKKKN